MAFQVSFFKTLQSVAGDSAQIPAGEPILVDSDGSYVAPAGARIMRLNPQGGTYNVTWSNGQVEQIDGVEFRGCFDGQTFTAVTA